MSDINPLEDDFRIMEPENPDYAEHQASRNITPITRLKLLRHIAEHHSYGYIDGILIDATTGSWLWDIYQALNETNRAKFISNDIAVMCDILYKMQAKGAVKLGFK